MHIYTITAGRTGTMWLSRLIRQNLGIETVHEHMGIDDFGTRTPDIRTMRNFNERGMTPLVQRFWQSKFKTLDQKQKYCETNHTLSKAGLVEFLSMHELANHVVFLNVRRDWVPLANSLLGRGDFLNATVVWQWYLHPQYRNKIVDSSQFGKFGLLGSILWYIAEVEARQQYYKLLFADRFRFVDCRLEDITTQKGATRILRQIGFKGTTILPGKVNDSQGSPDKQRLIDLDNVVRRLRFDPNAIAVQFIDQGRRIARVS